MYNPRKSVYILDINSELCGYMPVANDCEIVFVNLLGLTLYIDELK